MNTESKYQFSKKYRGAAITIPSLSITDLKEKDLTDKLASIIIKGGHGSYLSLKPLTAPEPAAEEAPVETVTEESSEVETGEEKPKNDKPKRNRSR